MSILGESFTNDGRGAEEVGRHPSARRVRWGDWMFDHVGVDVHSDIEAGFRDFATPGVS